jgi:KAP family P-loop domain
MAHEGKSLGTLPILRDDPLFLDGGSYDPALDAFNHEAYAQEIFNILQVNQPPLSIGLFGPWGIGKSTIIGILFKLISESKDCALKPIYFNAWKYSGDAFRRQFLIDVAKQTYEGNPNREVVARRLERLNYAEVLRETSEENLVGKLKEIFKFEGIKFKKVGLARLLFAGIVLVIGSVISFFTKSFYPVITGLLSAVVAFLMGMKFEDVFVIPETSVYDPQLIFPEQFEAEFRNIVGPSGPLGSLRPVIVIDDIDRCEAATIRDILVSAKTFLGQQKCFFIIPCDDRSIVQIFADPNQKERYRDELLRKYFNVGVRIAPLMATDLGDFVKIVSKGTEIPPSVVQIAILANYKDARKMKHFLNTFLVKYGIAKAREATGFMPVKIDDNLAGFAKAVLIEDLFPSLIARMAEHPEIYDVLEHAAISGNLQTDANRADLTRFDLEDWEEQYTGLKAILEKTRTVKIEHIEVFVSLKTTNPEARIPRGFQLKNSILEGDESSTEEIVKGISTPDAIASLAQVLLDLLSNMSDTFLTNTITTCLRWCYREGLFSDDDKLRIAIAVSHALAFDEGQKVLQQSAAAVLKCAQNAGNGYSEKLISKYELELSRLPTPTENLAETVNAIFGASKSPSRLSDVLNKKFESWVNTENGLELLLKIRAPEKLTGEQRVPSRSLVEKTIGAISTEASDGALALNKLRRAVVYRDWDPSLAEPLAARFLAILQQSLSDTAYSPRLEFVVQSILEKEECIEPQNAASLWAQFQPMYARFSDVTTKMQIHRAILVFAAICPIGTTKQAARDFAVQNWQSFSDAGLREVIEFLQRFQEHTKTELRTTLVRQEFTALQSENQAPTDRTKQRLILCIENRDALTANALNEFLMKTLQSSDTAFEVWRVVISELGGTFGSDFYKQIAQKCLSSVTDSHTPSRRRAFCELFATVLPDLEEDSKSQLLPSYFALCKHVDSNIRNAALSIFDKVRKLVDEQDFKLKLSPLIRELCRMTPSEVLSFRDVMDVAMEHSALFGDYEWRDLADVVKRSLSHADDKVQDYGLSLAERMPNVLPEPDDDLIYALIKIAKGPPSPQQERAEKRLRKLPEESLGPNSRRYLQEFLNPNEGHENKAP